MRKETVLFFLSLPLLFLITACSTPATGSYQDINVYDKALYADVMRKSFEYEGPARNPVIVIHGLLGSKLEDSKTKENIWGMFNFREMSRGNKFAKLAHPMELGKPLRSLTSDVRSSGLLEKSHVQVMGLSFEYEGYKLLVDKLTSSGYIPDNAPLPKDKHFYSQFIYYYDWRRDISANAAKLHEFILEKKKYLQKKYKELYGLNNYDVKFDLVAHSMGGLLARYYMRYGDEVLPDNPQKLPTLTMAGARHVDKLVIIATPNAGYVDTLLELNEGLRLAPGAPLYPKSIIGTFPSYYQMLPDPDGCRVLLNGNPVDFYALDTWIKYKWGLADPAEKQDQWLKVQLPNVKSPKERQKIALDHLNKCLLRALQFKHAMRIPAAQPDNVAVYLIAGDGVLTNDTVSVDPKTGKIKVIRKDAGDGKVTATSVRQDLRSVQNWLPFLVSPIDWNAVYYLQGGHMGVMNSAVFETNLRYILLAAPTKYQKKNIRKYSELIGNRTPAHGQRRSK